MLVCAHFKLMSLPLLGSDFCIQIMESYLGRVLGMIKRATFEWYTLADKAEADVKGCVCVCSGNELKLHMSISSGQSKKPKHLLCYVSTTLEGETFKLVFGCSMLHILILYNLKTTFNLNKSRSRTAAWSLCSTGITHVHGVGLGKGCSSTLSVTGCTRKPRLPGAFPPFSLLFWDGIFLCCPCQCQTPRHKRPWSPSLLISTFENTSSNNKNCKTTTSSEASLESSLHQALGRCLLLCVSPDETQVSTCCPNWLRKWSRGWDRGAGGEEVFCWHNAFCDCTTPARRTLHPWEGFERYKPHQGTPLQCLPLKQEASFAGWIQSKETMKLSGDIYTEISHCSLTVSLRNNVSKPSLTKIFQKAPNNRHIYMHMVPIATVLQP